MTITIAQLKEKYIVGPPNSGADCDVGGALCLEMTPQADRDALKDLISYPTFSILADYLAIANTRCGEMKVIDYARAICTLGDEEQWEEAWDILGRALIDSE